MTEDFSYRDPKLSIWQAAAADVQRRRSSQQGIAAQPLQSQTLEVHTENPFMAPAHLVGQTLGKAGKPLEQLFQDVKTGIVKLKAKFDPLDDCATAAARFLQAEVDGDDKNSAIYAGQLQMGVCNVVGWAECVSTYLGYKILLQHPMYRLNENPVIDLKGASKLAIIGDWGTGLGQAKLVLGQVADMKPDILLHLGDVYFAGTQAETQNNFLSICRSTLGNIPVFSLCGNHDMYSGGAGYYSLLDQIGQQASYFCLQNDDWMFLAMDTGFHDNNPFTISTKMTQLVTEGAWSETAWHLNQIKNAGNRKIVLLSHHQLFSPFSSVGSVNGEQYAYNPNLYQIFAPILSKVEWWFWGHEHTLGIYGDYMGLKRGRCVGASAVPVFQDQQSYATANGLKTVDGTMPTWDANGVLGGSAGAYNNCFAMMTLTGASAEVRYYEVPQGGGIRPLDVVDKTQP
jgi:Calcineurin-like phosphoesterase